MKIRPLQILTAAYFLLIFFFLHSLSIFAIALFIISVATDLLSKIKTETKNMFYLLSALSAITPLFSIFLIYLPFIFFGLLLKEKSFVKKYILGFSISFIPSTAIYLITTYLSVKLNLYAIAVIFYALPAAALILLRKKSFGAFEISHTECYFAIIVLFFTLFVGIRIIDNENLFVSNSSRDFYRIQNAIKGLSENGLMPLYDPNIGSGEATYLWVPPGAVANFAVGNLLLYKIPPILYFNSISLFILLLFVLSTGELFRSIIGKRSLLDELSITAVTVLTALNFFIIQSVESIRAFFVFPIANLILSLILDNPASFKDILIIMYLCVLALTIHPAFGLAVFIFSACLLFFTKLYYISDRSEIKQAISSSAADKIKFLLAVFFIALLPLFYVSTPYIFKEFLVDDPGIQLNFMSIFNNSINFFRSFYGYELKFLSLHYPDVSRIDDHKFGLFLSVFGVAGFIFLMLMYKIKSLKKFRTLVFGFMLHLAGLALLSMISIRVGRFFRTPGIYLLMLLGASIAAIISLVKNRIVKIVLALIVIGAFFHALPYYRQNMENLHKEQFMSGQGYKGEMDAIKKLPIDGRIMTYGIYNNVVDYGIGYLTGRYASRNENAALRIDKTPHEKIHGQNSFGEPDLVQTKSGQELYNYLRAGGYKYLFMNLQYPTGNYVASQIYPNFSYPIYQNGPLALLVVKNVSYAEKTDVVKNIDEKIYKEKDGYRYTAISDHYNFKYDEKDFKQLPGEPELLKFERETPTKVNIFGQFHDGDFVVFKEQYISRWRAYMNDKEIPVLTNNHEMILVRTAKGDKISFEYAPLTIEKIIGALSMIGFLGVASILVYLLKKTAL